MANKKTIRDILYIIGLGVIIGTYITFMHTFYAAYTNDYSILVTINDYGEAHIEFLISIITLPVVLWIFYVNFKKNVLEEGEVKNAKFADTTVGGE